MEIIPVIDVMGGKVVHASHGDRSNYRLLRSCLTHSHQPEQVISDMLAFYSFSAVYIADLDAIVSGKLNEVFYQQISHAFPSIQIWLDAGVKTKEDWDKITQYPNIHCVIGTETLQARSWLKEPVVQQKSILSLDFKLAHFLGDSAILADSSYWPKRIIVMNLDCIGSQSGPDFDLLSEIQTKTRNEVIAAGGVRDMSDLQLLKQQKIGQALIASALHDGRLTMKMISDLL